MADEDLLYKLWLNITCGHNPSLIDKCRRLCGSAEEIYNSDAAYKKLLSALDIRTRLKARRSLDKARQLAEYCEQSGISIITAEDKKYPKRLAQIYNPLRILYVKGELPDIDNLVCITIAGKRDCSEYSKKFAARLGYDLAKAGILIVSGMAKGIDAAAHSAALKAGHQTVALLAGGVDVVYPKENAGLYDKIIKNGAVISERPPGTAGRGTFYKERNRIMVGLSCGTVIVEGDLHSGTKLSAAWAIESNRDLFAVPGKPDDKGAELPNSLIKDSAKLITSAEDIVEEYIGAYPIELSNGLKMLSDTSANELPYESAETNIKYKNNGYSEKIKKNLVRKKPDFDKFDDKQRIILEYLYNNNEAVHIDDISRDCNIPTTELSFLIIQLMMARAVKEHAGDYYSISAE